MVSTLYTAAATSMKSDRGGSRMTLSLTCALQDELGETAVTGVVSVAADSDEAETQFEVRCSLNHCLVPPVQLHCMPEARHWYVIVGHRHAAEGGSIRSIAVPPCVLFTSLHTMLLLQAFQVSDQAVRLVCDDWFQPQEQPSGESKLRNPKVRGARLPLKTSRCDCLLFCFPAGQAPAATCAQLLCWGSPQAASTAVSHVPRLC